MTSLLPSDRPNSCGDKSKYSESGKDAAESQNRFFDACLAQDLHGNSRCRCSLMSRQGFRFRGLPSKRKPSMPAHGIALHSTKSNRIWLTEPVNFDTPAPSVHSLGNGVMVWTWPDGKDGDFMIQNLRKRGNLLEVFQR